MAALRNFVLLVFVLLAALFVPGVASAKTAGSSAMSETRAAAEHRFDLGLRWGPGEIADSLLAARGGEEAPKFKWGNPKSTPAYGHTFSTGGRGHSATIKPEKLIDRARTKGHQIGQWLDDQAAANFISDVAKQGPGVHVVPLPAGVSGRSFLGDGKEFAADMATIVVKPNGAVRTAIPFSSAHPTR